MPNITLENKIKVVGDIYKIEHVTYELPYSIKLGSKVLNYDMYHNVYTDYDGTVEISAEHYLRSMLKSKEKDNTQSL